MAQVPQNTREQIARARPYETNFRVFGRGLAAFAGGPVLRDKRIEVYACPFWSVFNAYLPPRWSPSATPRNVRAALRLGQQTGRGMMWIVGPSANADAVRAELLGHGLKCGYWVPFMHRDLAVPIPRGPKPSGIRLDWIDDLRVFDDHPHPYLGPMTTKVRRAHRDYHQKLIDADKARLIVAWHGDKPVGTTLIFAYRGSAGLYDVGVVEPFRGRGIGEALLLESLRGARRLGLDCAVLSAASKAVPLYARVGFTDAGSYGSYYVGKDRLKRLGFDAG